MHYRVTGYEACTDNALAGGAFLKDFTDEQAVLDWLLKFTGPEMNGHILIEYIETI